MVPNRPCDFTACTKKTLALPESVIFFLHSFQKQLTQDGQPQSLIIIIALRRSKGRATT